MSQTPNTAIAVIAIDVGKNSFHIVGHDVSGAIVLRQKTAPKRHFRSAPNNGHHQTGPACLKRRQQQPSRAIWCKRIPKGRQVVRPFGQR
jgi:hypothetical protein